MPPKQTLEEFISKSIAIFGNEFDYSSVNYVNAATKVVLICKKHGPFNIKPKDHIRLERGCSVCSGVIYNTQTFIKKAKLTHGDRFDYNNVNYSGIFNKVSITCKVHGDWYQTPDRHLQGRGCPKCKKSSRKDLDFFIKTANSLHKNKYDYSKVIFTRMFDNVIITCSKHGDFKQTPANHIHHKHGCSACMVGTSKKEIEWLDYIGVPNNNSCRSVILHIGGRRLIVDGYDGSTNTIYEFYGDYWHGNPKRYNPKEINKGNKTSFGKLYEKTMLREKFIHDNGFNLVTMWEIDFDTIKDNNR